MDQVAQIREKIDIITFLSEFIPLKKAGRNFKAPCPFHQEKSPSFVVSPDRQIWHCFGCGKGGDVYSFLMEYEHIEFPEALRTLAQRAGIELVQDRQFAGTNTKKEQIYKINAASAEFYHYVLTKHPAGKKALSYLEKRGVNPKVIETFKIGFAPRTGSVLTRYLVGKKKFARDDILDAGIATQRGAALSDFFFNRLIFPLSDHRDNIIGFSGRVLDEVSSGPKYINTRETLVYHKGEVFFGLNITKEAIRKENKAILVEGEFDVMTCFEHGVPNVIAIKGTALTEMQVTLISRFAEKIAICFDGDAAGQMALRRSLPLIEKKGLTTSVIVLPGGKDPDEAIKQSGETAFQIAVKNDINIYDYLLKTTLERFDTTLPSGKKAVSDELLPVFAGIDNEIIKEHYLKKLSTELDTTLESIQKELDRKKTRQQEEVIKITKKEKKERVEIIEEYLLALILQSDTPNDVIPHAYQILKDVLDQQRAGQKIIKYLSDFSEQTESFDPKKFSSFLPAELLQAYDQALLFPLPSFQDKEKERKEIEKTSLELKEVYIRQKLQQLSLEIKKAEKTNENEDELDVLKGKYSELLHMLPKH
jgi:DNA primase